MSEDIPGSDGAAAASAAGPARSGVVEPIRTVTGRLLRSADFERVLRTRSQARTIHFAVHHLGDRPGLPVHAGARRVAAQLSTGPAPTDVRPVDDSSLRGPRAALAGAVWLGAVVPKRHARRSVTRSLLKRQIRAAVGACADTLAGGIWVVRLRAPFDRTSFLSAASDELKRAARGELDQLLAEAAQRAARR